jgi:hypothetical protein
MHRYFCIFPIVTLLIPVFLCSQPDSFNENYSLYRESSLNDRRFKHAEIQSLIKQLPDTLFEVRLAGHSLEGREIYLVKAGNGQTKVLLWSQMHGNEPTATMAIMDIFNYLIRDQGKIRNQILDKLSLYFIPMLNPDGADAFQRRNALDIDLNRDALRLQCPESQILKGIRDELEPEWGFNLHDQNRYTSAGKTEQMASISFLAPAFNEEKDWNTGRTRAMQLICHMNAVLQTYIPGKVGRYSDEFEPRAFGDNMQKWGTNTILIETGAITDDPEKQYLRKLNYISILSAFQSITSGTFEKYRLADYEKIPFNQGVLHDLIVRNATIHLFDRDFLLDIGIRQDEIQNKSADDYYLRAYIADLGDLHNYFGYDEYDAAGQEVRYEKLYERSFSHLKDLEKSGITNHLMQGYTTFRVDALPEPAVMDQLPFRLIKTGIVYVQDGIRMGQNPVLTFWHGNELKAILVNGTVHLWETIKDRW